MLHRLTILLILCGLLGLIGSGCSTSNPQTSSSATAAQAKKPPKAINGVLDATDWDFAKDGPITLDGEWDFYWSSLLPTSQFLDPAANTPAKTGTLTVPGAWRGKKVEGQELTEDGYATLHLLVKTKGLHGRYGIRSTEMFTSFQLFVEDQLLSQAGVVGKTAEEAVPRFLTQVTFFTLDQDTVHITLHVSNYFFRSAKSRSLVFGTEEHLLGQRERGVAYDGLLFGGILFMGMSHIAFFLVRRKDLSGLYFGLTCLLVALRIFMTGSDRLLGLAFPEFDWFIRNKLMYLTIPLASSTLLLYIRYTFPGETSLRLVRWYLVACAPFVALILFTSNKIFDRFLVVLILFVLFVLFYSVWVAVKAMLRKSPGTYLFMIGFAFLILGFINEALYTLGIVQGTFMSGDGLFLFMLAQSFMLSKKYAQAFVRIEDLSERLLELDKAKDQFFAQTSHELRTPLHGMIGLAESLRTGVAGSLPAAANNHLQLIISSGWRLVQLVNDILDYSKLKEKQITLRKVPVDLAQVVEFVLLVLQPLASKKQLTLRHHIPPNTIVYADEARLQQIFHNLIGNSIKFTDTGSVSVRMVDRVERIEIQVSDTGSGIEPEHMERIFESYEQAGVWAQQDFIGSGLGLHVCRELVELHGGQLGVESAVGVGSTFHFTLELHEPKISSGTGTYAHAHGEYLREAAPAFIPLAATLEKLEHPAASLQPKAPLILIVDDDPVNLQVMQSYLYNEPCVVHEAQSGAEALRLLKEGMKPDLILLDVMMPKLSGIEVCQRIRQQYSLTELPILMLTANNQVSDLIKGFDAGANDYLLKPIGKDELMVRVSMHLQLARWNQELEEKVIERTAELEEVNHQLRDSMVETAKAMANVNILEERNRIAHDVHDIVGHTLTVTNIQMESVKLLLNKDIERAVERMEKLQELIRQSLTEVRRTVRMLKEGDLDEDILFSLETLIKETEQYTGAVINYEMDIVTPVGAVKHKILYHALQEALTNGFRHGQSTRFSFMLREQDGQIRFRLESNGNRFGDSSLGFGLTAMKERIELCNGSFHIEDGETEGCVLSITLPV
ncbi:ATP-binding protein [Brevibacillus dissolubilis]|uniref:ATP-binding protein n=1 Tax=Brevibacillus dissolubilis TaxID=1844116 RepID=UPI00159BD89A|nr:ATP-binding protein [Brevibacillus dissolubilis]